MRTIRSATAKDNNGYGTRRSTPGRGQQCFIHVIGRADEFKADSIVGSYGQISAGCGPSLGEDFSETIWPVVIKVLPHVVEGDLIQHLRDLADLLEKHRNPEHMQRTLAEGWQWREEDISEAESDPGTNINFVPPGGDVVNIDTWRDLPKPIAEQLRSSMRRHWAAALRPPEFSHAVLRDCPGATLEEFNAAADAVWADLKI